MPLYIYLVKNSGISISFLWKVGKMCSRTCVGVTNGKKALTHTLRTHDLEVVLHAHVWPHYARVHARTHLCNPYLAFFGRIYILRCTNLLFGFIWPLIHGTFIAQFSFSVRDSSNWYFKRSYICNRRLWGQPIKLVHTVTSSELHESWQNDLVFFKIIPSHFCRAS